MSNESSKGWDQRTRLMGNLNPQLLHRMYNHPFTIPHGLPLRKSSRCLDILLSHRNEKFAVLPVALRSWDGDLFEIPRHGLRPSSRTDLVFPYEITPDGREPRNIRDLIDLAQRWAYSEADPQPRQRY